MGTQISKWGAIWEQCKDGLFQMIGSGTAAFKLHLPFETSQICPQNLNLPTYNTDIMFGFWNQTESYIFFTGASVVLLPSWSKGNLVGCGALLQF